MELKSLDEVGAILVKLPRVNKKTMAHLSIIRANGNAQEVIKHIDGVIDTFGGKGEHWCVGVEFTNKATSARGYVDACNVTDIRERMANKSGDDYAFCLNGAVKVVVSLARHDTHLLLSAMCGRSSIARYNDRGEWRKVKALLTKARSAVIAYAM